MKQIKPYHTPHGNAIQEPTGGTQRPTKGSGTLYPTYRKPFDLLAQDVKNGNWGE